MHYHLEIVLPPTDDIQGAIEHIMEPFNEKREDVSLPFWDFFSIGGRFAGAKKVAGYDKATITAFHEWCQTEGVTVSGIQCGKQTLQPAEQIPKVDAKWNELFPPDDGKPAACPLFDHSNDRYGHDGNSSLPGDICTLKEAGHATCGHVIFAAPSYVGDVRTGPPEAIFMLTTTAWNGVNFMPVKWDGTLAQALALWKERLKGGSEEYRKACDPQDDWLAVTVDYHS